MIPKRYIVQWFQNAPWQNNGQVEQDLILSRVLSEIYSNSLLREQLVLRGGTALNKLFFNPSLRYSEDIDLVQLNQGPIGELMTALHQTLDPWLGKPKYKQSQGRVTLYYRFETEHAPTRTMKVKVEINTREHGSELKLVEIPFLIENGWYSKQTSVTTYCLEELIATKLRALYQRRKGRDLFDIYQVLTQYETLDTSAVIHCFSSYLSKDKLHVSCAEFEENMASKMEDSVFMEDILPLLPPHLSYDPYQAYHTVHERIISKLPGKKWERSKKQS